MLKTSTIIVVLLSATAAVAEVRLMPADGRFCPTWAEAHERTLASLNNGRPPYAVRWQGCVMLKKGQQVDVVDVDSPGGAVEIIYHRRHWFSDGGLF